MRPRHVREDGDEYTNAKKKPVTLFKNTAYSAQVSNLIYPFRIISMIGDGYEGREISHQNNRFNVAISELLNIESHHAIAPLSSQITELQL